MKPFWITFNMFGGAVLFCVGCYLARSKQYSLPIVILVMAVGLSTFGLGLMGLLTFHESAD